MFNPRERNSGRFRTILDAPEEDPLSGVANLFDVSMVFMAALMLALAVNWKNSAPTPAQAANQSASGEPILEAMKKQGLKLERYHPTDNQIGGAGQRLGMAYQLKNGDVVYVPEAKASPTPPAGTR